MPKEITLTNAVHSMYHTCMSSKAFNITLPQELVKKIDIAAKREYSNRSDYIRGVLVRDLNEREQWSTFFEKTQAKGNRLGIKTEQQVYDTIEEYKNKQRSKHGKRSYRY